jgi:hypothetical protein
MHTRRYDEYMERHEDDGVYQEEIEEHQYFMVSNGVGLAELATPDIELVKEEPGPSKKRFQKSQWIIERQQRRE